MYFFCVRLLCFSALHNRFVTVNCNLRSRYRINGLSHRLWMYRRIYKQTGELRDEFINGVEDFDNLQALSKSLYITTRKNILGDGQYRRPMANFRRPTLWATKQYRREFDVRMSKPKVWAAKFIYRRPYIVLGDEKLRRASTGNGPRKGNSWP